MRIVLAWRKNVLIQAKIDVITSSKDYDGDVTVACMCATKRAAQSNE